ncbi:MAG TPA: septum formation protein Maf [Bacteroidetes bacterium]|nr:septum formation protein Maf [Bacteroidota bacterium]
MGFPSLILASKSPRRRLLLRQIGFKFTVRASRVAERFSRNESPAHNAKRIALEKAREIASQVREGIVVGADTIVVVGNRILGKPRSKPHAVRMLKLLSGREHIVLTAFALVDGRSGRYVVDIEKTKVLFRRLSEEEIRGYVASGSPMDKAGAYGIQDDYGAVFVQRVEGCFYNVVGFPLTKFYVTLQEFLKTLDR